MSNLNGIRSKDLISIKLIYLFLILILLTGCKKESINDTINDNFKIETTPVMICHNENTQYYSSQTQTIYLSCLTNISLVNGTSQMELSKYLSLSSKTLDEEMDNITSKLILEETLYDGGTKVYIDSLEEPITDKGITIVKCNTISGNKDIYIGPKDSNLTSNCEN